jgi:tRNA (Thr-GGU) A37 N-methylase
MPIQPAGARGMRDTVELYKEYGAGLSDLGGFSRIILIYHFHRSNGWDLMVTPFLDTVPHGVFATRAPAGRTQSGSPLSDW